MKYVIFIFWICVLASCSVSSALHPDVGDFSVGDEPYERVDVMPEFPGGQGALYEYVTIGYPEDYEGCAQGRVVVSFVVEKDGYVTNVKVERSLCAELDDAAVKHTRNMPRWIPGKLGGNPVRTCQKVAYVFRVQ